MAAQQDLTTSAPARGVRGALDRLAMRDARHGPLPPLLMLLTVVPGLVDAVSFLALGRVFVANMTGNIVFLGFAIADAADFSIPASLTAILAFLLSREYAAPLAYIGGSMGTLIGADLLNLDKIGGLGAPVASIGGAGTFDGIFLTGILAVLLAGIASPSRPREVW